MTQKRYFDFLADLSQNDLSEFLKDILPTGRYVGLIPSISNGSVVLSAGKYIMSNGLVVAEDSEVTVGPVPATSGNSPTVKTIVAKGPSITTVQRTNVEYSIEEGLLNYSSYQEVDPIFIVGWMLFNGVEWTFQYEEPRNSASLVQQESFSLPIPGMPADLLTCSALSGDGNFGAYMSIPVSGTNPAEFLIPFNNVNPLKDVTMSIDVPANVSLTVNAELYGDGPRQLLIGNKIIDYAGVANLDLGVSQPNFTNCLMKLTLSSPDDFNVKILKMGYEIDPSYVGT